MDITHLVAKRSTCIRRQVGAILVKDKRILSTGYNGAPSGVDHCLDVGCLREQKNVPSGERHELCRGSHAEQNAMNQILLTGQGQSLVEASIYCTLQPCIHCLKNIASVGINKLIYELEYNSDDSKRDKAWKDRITEYNIDFKQVKLDCNDKATLASSIIGLTSSRRILKDED